MGSAPAPKVLEIRRKFNPTIRVIQRNLPPMPRKNTSGMLVALRKMQVSVRVGGERYKQIGLEEWETVKQNMINMII